MINWVNIAKIMYNNVCRPDTGSDLLSAALFREFKKAVPENDPLNLM